MSAAKIAHLPDRGVVGVTGQDAASFLQGLITNDLSKADGGRGPSDRNAIFAGLLSPQGKILFDFFAVSVPGGYWLDVAGHLAGDLVKRLSMYKLRAEVAITDLSPGYDVAAAWGPDMRFPPHAITFHDPRHNKMGIRSIIEKARKASDQPSTGVATDPDYHAYRITLGVPEGGKDYDFGDAYPHEAGFDLFNGVSFTKGCYVGQEVVARMQNKSVIRKRVVKISAAAPLMSGKEILFGDVPIGRVGSADERSALAILRLDRAVEAADAGTVLTSGGIAVAPDAAALDHYRRAAAAHALKSGLA